jgi:hypothetical protein
MRDPQGFWYGHYRELSANDTIWACVILADCGLMCRQDHADIRRDRVLESEVCFCSGTVMLLSEQLHRMFIAWNKSRG